jgi:hypothetical protein
MKISIIIISLIFTITGIGLGQEPTEPQGKQHTRFFLRMQGGFGSGRTVEENVLGSDIELSGGGGAFRFQIGGALSRNLHLYGEVGAFAISNPDVTWQGLSGTIQNTDVSVTDIGAGISYYFMPVNIYLASTLTISQNRIKIQGLGEATSEAGPGIYISAGKEWWVSDRWGLGVAIFGSFSRSKDKGDGLEYDIKNRAFGVLFSATLD